jgi:uncharacterized damage-inducible protein DinB
MEHDEIVRQLIETWRKHNEILLYLLANVPTKGMSAVPAASRGRTVAAQFAHLDKVRRGWVEYHTTGKHPRLPRADKSADPTRAKLKQTLSESSRLVEDHLLHALNEDAKTRMFNGSAIRWMGYLIAHESHHRGQILLALKQNGMRLKEDVAMHGVWGKWISGE